MSGWKGAEAWLMYALMRAVVAGIWSATNSMLQRVGSAGRQVGGRGWG
jgi:hypothetical protein